jgi:hypothetical protein
MIMPKDYRYKERIEARREELAKSKRKTKAIGSRVQSPDQQYATGMMGKQPVAVFPRLKGQR